MKRLIATAILGLALSPLAHAVSGRLVDVQVIDAASGRALPEYRTAGRWFVPGDAGRPYSVQLVNRTGERVLAVLSVDGVNAVSGETAGAQQAGYVLGPWERAEIRGWRKSLAESAEFYFTDLPDSYAARTGRPDNVGVIGVAVFREARRWQTPPVARERDERAPEPWYGGKSESAPAPAAPSASDGIARDQGKAGRGVPQELGTGHGQRRWDPVDSTRFERRSQRPDEIVSVFYDDRQALIARGVIPPPPRHRSGPREPDPFPQGFVPDPWGRRW
jgi:hypothetical protein